MPKFVISNDLWSSPFSFPIIEFVTYIDEIIYNQGHSDNI